jgi:hypothetical protein
MKSLFTTHMSLDDRHHDLIAPWKFFGQQDWDSNELRKEAKQRMLADLFVAI